MGWMWQPVREQRPCFLYSILRSRQWPSYCAVLEIDLALTLAGDVSDGPPGNAAVHVLLFVCANTGPLLNQAVQGRPVYG